MHIEIARGMQIQAHVAAVGVDEHVIGPAGNLQVAFRLQLRSGLVVDNLVGAQNVVAIVDHYPAGQRSDIAQRPMTGAGPHTTGTPVAGAAPAGPRAESPGRGRPAGRGKARRRQRFGRGHPWRVCSLDHVFDGRGCRIGQRLPPKLQVTEGQHRDKH